MRNLLRGEIYRYKHSSFFWVMVGASILSGAFYGISVINGAFEDMFVVPLFVILAVFISLTIGREYSDGTIRNKIIAGKTKTYIFISKLIVSFSVTIIMVSAFLIPCVAIISTDVLFKISVSTLLWILLGFFLLNIGWAVIFTFVSSLISSKEIAGIINFTLIILIMFSSYQLESMVAQPEFVVYENQNHVPMSPEEVEEIQKGIFKGSYISNEDDNGVISYYKIVVTDKPKSQNPHFVPEPFKTVLQTIDSVLPYGQINEYISYINTYAYDDVMDEDNPRIKSFPLYSLFLITVLSGTGLVLFRKKDFK